MNTAIIGAGAWGTALAIVACQNGHTVTLWGHNSDHVAALERTRTNERHLPGFAIPAALRLEADAERAVADADLIVLAVPSTAFRSIAGRISSAAGLVVSVTKGIEAGTGLTMSGLIAEMIPRALPAALSGPSLAVEVARGIPTAVVAASVDPAQAKRIQTP
jgi:glycerol-3-phosphate dehydrogenase (NAD(P)+)